MPVFKIKAFKAQFKNKKKRKMLKACRKKEWCWVKNLLVNKLKKKK